MYHLRYVLLGLLYLVVVHRRSRVYNSKIREIEEKTQTPEETLGLPRHYGIFYSLGLAMVAEGICSALYHVCKYMSKCVSKLDPSGPNASNFQFDTAFM